LHFISCLNFGKAKVKEEIYDRVTSKVRGKKSYIYALIEHLTNPDQFVPFKLLRYQIPVMQLTFSSLLWWYLIY
jgi:predicted transposase YdaD